MSRLANAGLVLLALTLILLGQSVFPPSGGSSSGTAGGDLSGSYPNPTVAKVNGVTVSVDGSSNLSFPAGIKTGVGSGVAGFYSLGQGTDPSALFPDNSFSIYVPTSASAKWKLYGSNSAGAVTDDGSGNLSVNGYSGTGLICRASGSACSPGGALAAFPLTFVQSAAVGCTSACASLTVTFPQTTAASGNTLFMFVSADGSTTFTVPSGWTADINQTQATYSRLVVLHKTSAAESSASLVIGATGAVSAYFFEVSGTHAIDQSSASGQAGQVGVTLPAITPTAGAAVFALAAFTQSAAVNSEQPAPPIDPAWHTIAVNGWFDGARTLYGYVLATPGVNSSTRPPSMYFGTTGIHASSGVAYATFSIL